MMRMMTFCCVLLSVSLCAAELVPIGNVTATMATGPMAEFQLDSGAIARVEVMDAALARIRINPVGAFSTRESLAIAPRDLEPPLNPIFDTESVTWLITERMKIAVMKTPFRVVALHADGGLMSADLEHSVGFDAATGLILCRKYAPPDEAIFGLGMRGGPINRRGRTIFMRNTDSANYGEFTDPLYQSYPLYYGLFDGKAYGLFFDNPAYPFFDVASSEPGVLTFGAQQGELNYYLIAGPDPQDVSRTYGRLTGFNPLPPQWSLGYHHSRYGWHSEAEVRQIAEELRAQDFPTDALWFDIDYMNNRQAFSWNPVTFPQPIQMHLDLRKDGFRSIYINEPCFRDDDRLWPYLDALSYFVKNGTGDSLLNTIWFGNVSWYDFSYGEAYEWYKTQLKTFLSAGIDGLWNDLNEPANNFMPDAQFYFDGDVRSETEARNLYALLVNRVAYEAQRELRPNVRPWNFSRGGYAGIQRYAHTWAGDAPSTFDSLRVAIQTSISMGLSGQNQFGHDTGGFMGSPSAELFVRWLEFSLFTPLFRNHSINTADPREPWVFGEPYTSTIRELVKWRYRLVPYIYTLFEQASRTGLPVLMPTFFYAEEDAATYAQDTEYLFGPFLLVAPVFQEGATARSLYLPRGSCWIHYPTDKVYAGGSHVTVDAPMGMPPLFVREGGLIVTGEPARYIGDPLASPDLSADIYPLSDAAYTHYEDEGNGYDYQYGVYLRTAITAEIKSTGLQCALERVDGTYVPRARHWWFQIHLQDVPPSSIAVDGGVVPQYFSRENLASQSEGWYWDEPNQLLIVRFPDAAVTTIDIRSD